MNTDTVNTPHGSKIKLKKESVQYNTRNHHHFT